MSVYIPEKLRKEVAERAKFACEYCLLHEEDGFHTFHVDHIIPLKHGGPTLIENLSFTCPICNRNKGADIATVFYPSRIIIRLFDPRNDDWLNHFEIVGAAIKSKTKIGEATIKILGFNQSERLIERSFLIEVGRYPST